MDTLQELTDRFVAADAEWNTETGDHDTLSREYLEHLAKIATGHYAAELERREAAHRRDLQRNANITQGFVEELERLRAQLATSARQRHARIVCICGSMRYQAEMLQASVTESLAGHIVVLPLVNTKQPDPRWETPEQQQRIKTALDRLHRAKIALADEVLVVCPGGYIGESTAREIAYATELGVPIRCSHPHTDTEETR